MDEQVYIIKGTEHTEEFTKPDKQKLREQVACLHCGRRTRTYCGLVMKDFSSHWCNEAAKVADQILSLNTVKLERLTPKEALKISLEATDGLSNDPLRPREIILLNGQLDKIKKDNPGITFEEG